MQLQLETTSTCNARCVFCPYPTMKRAHGTMAMDLFKKIIDEATTIPLVDHVTLTGLGEPLLDRFVVERIKYIRAKMPAVMIDLYTNGNLLRPKIIDQLHAAGLSVLYVSLNAVNADKRLQIMKLDDFDTVIAGIEYALTKPNWKVIVKGIVTKDLMEQGDNEDFTRRWGGSFAAGGNAFLHLEGSWAGSSQMWPLRVLGKEPCGRALGQIMVLQDGRVSACCFDGEGDMIFGDLNTQTLREVYGGADYVTFRSAHVSGNRGSIPMCANCTAI